MPSQFLRNKALELALALNHPAYDCFYLALAIERDVRFVTLDGEFLAKARGGGYGESVVHLEEWGDSSKSNS